MFASSSKLALILVLLCTLVCNIEGGFLSGKKTPEQHTVQVINSVNSHQSKCSSNCGHPQPSPIVGYGGGHSSEVYQTHIPVEYLLPGYYTHSDHQYHHEHHSGNNYVHAPHHELHSAHNYVHGASPPVVQHPPVVQYQPVKSHHFGGEYHHQRNDATAFASTGSGHGAATASTGSGHGAATASATAFSSSGHNHPSTDHHVYHPSTDHHVYYPSTDHHHVYQPPPNFNGYPNSGYALHPRPRHNLFRHHHR